jgi:hypothetical protein
MRTRPSLKSVSGGVLLGGCPRIAIFSQIEECEKNKHRHIVDISSIIF